ncbi:MAG: TRAP transporter small permease subunit [Deltaproteobacteria bacterium]|nr:TRAP transporter small permease subunit [Deltaproteobacteria bacterium]
MSGNRLVIERVADYTDNVIRVFCVILILFIFLTVISQIILRAMNLSGALWAEEIVRLMTIITGFLGSSVAFKAGAHTVMDSLTMRLSSKARFRVSCLANAFIVAFLVAYTVCGIRICLMIPTHTPVLRIKLAHMFIALPLSGILMLFYLVIPWIRSWRSKDGRLHDRNQPERGEES